MLRTLKKGVGIYLALWTALIAVCALGTYIYDKVSICRLRRELADNASLIRSGSLDDDVEAWQIRAVAIRRLAIGLYEIRDYDRRVALLLLRAILQHKTDPEWWTTRALNIQTLDPYVLVGYIATGTLPSMEDD